jgi:cytochrome c-type biogenesis protein CcmH
MKQFAAIIFTLLMTTSALAAIDEKMSDPVLEARARALQKELRCLVCQGQSLDDSDAELAHDLRHLIRERIAAGQSEDAIKHFLVERYGNFVLMKPPVESDTYALWFGPALFLVVGAGAVAITIARARRRTAVNETGKRDF